MLKIIKEMQSKGVFSLLPTEKDLSNIIKNINDGVELNSTLCIIQNYIKSLDLEYKYIYDVSLNRSLQDFCDKFQFEMFDMYTSKQITKGTIYEKNLSFNKAGECKFGISSDEDVKFTLYERKLLKIINHYYINLKTNEKYKDNDFVYIPIDKLKLMFLENINSLVFRNIIIETCERLNSKKIYWSMVNTIYSKTKDLKKKKILNGENDKIVDITILYLPRNHKTNKQGYVNSILGIICKISNFMKLRYELKHIDNSFPMCALRYKYLDFIIIEKLVFLNHIYKIKNSAKLKTLENKRLKVKVKNEIISTIHHTYIKSLTDLTREIYYYEDQQTSITYFTKICNEPNSKRRLIEILDSISRVANILYKHDKCVIEIIVRNKTIKIISENKILNGNDIFNEILKIIGKITIKGQVVKFFRDGEIALKITL